MEKENGQPVIALIEDDVYVGDMLEKVLTKAGYEVARAASGTEALQLLQQRKIDLALLDLMLPGLCGEEVLQHMGADLPVIVVSAKKELKSKVDLLLGGAADYITKPFQPEELLARITVQLRKKQEPASEPSLTYRELTLWQDSRRLTVDGNLVKLTKTEFCILELLMRNPKRVISKSLLLDAVNEITPDCQEESLKVHVSNLRNKLRQVTGRDYIEAIWGIGFKLREF